MPIKGPGPGKYHVPQMFFRPYGRKNTILVPWLVLRRANPVKKEDMKLDVTCMRYLTKDDFRVLVAVEMGMRNHELVPVELITSIAKLRHGGIYKILSTLLRYKLVAHSNQQYNGYRLSYLGFDILALRTLLAQDIIVSVGSQIGT